MEIGTEREAVGRRTIPLRFRLERSEESVNAYVVKPIGGMAGRL
jgi:hypothetical protein